MVCWQGLQAMNVEKILKDISKKILNTVFLIHLFYFHFLCGVWLMYYIIQMKEKRK